jgi:VWFA-related protein
MRWMKCWKKLARRARLRPAIAVFLIALLTSPAVPQETTLRSQANVVLIPTLVKDVQGGIVYGLMAKDFIVEDDGVEQPSRLDEERDTQPISLVIAIQTGRRAFREFGRMRGLNTMLEPIISNGAAQVAIVEFDSHVHGTRSFTSSPEQIAQDLSDLQPGDGGAAILDAIDYSVKALNAIPKERQRMLLLISETRDHGSHGATIDDIVASIGQSNIVVFALAFSPYFSQQHDIGQAANKDEWSPGIDILGQIINARQAMRKNTPKSVVTMTGGEYEMFPTQKKFDARMNDFSNHLRSRYMLSIEPKNPHPGFHRISVRLRKPQGEIVLARGSYWARGTE